MSQGNAVVLGPTILGKEGFAKQQREIATEGGAIGIGKELQKPFVPKGKAPIEAPALTHDEARRQAQESVGKAARERAAQLEVKRIEREQAAAAAAAAAAAKAKGGKKAKAGKPSAPLVDGVPAPTTSAPAAASFAEDDVMRMLSEDPNQWNLILEAEKVRPEGPRPIVATMVLAAADKMDTRPIPPEVLTVLLAIQDQANPPK